MAELDAAEAGRVAQTNYVGAVPVLVPIGQRLRAQGPGALAMLSSVAAERPRRANSVYGSSKAALDAYGQGLADALVSSGARVMVVRPGFVHSKITVGGDPTPFSTRR